jgi:hypothetical protein
MTLKMAVCFCFDFIVVSSVWYGTLLKLTGSTVLNMLLRLHGVVLS